MAGSELVQSLLRGLELLRLAGSRPGGMRLTELADAAGLKVNTAHNLVRTLCARGFLIKDSMSRFTVGPAVFELAAGARDERLRERIGQELLKLAVKFPHDTLTVSKIIGGMVRCVLRISADRPGELQKSPEISFAPYASTTAVLLQSYFCEAIAALEKQYPFEEYGAGIWGSREEFAKVRAEVRRRGYFLRHNQEHFTLAFLLLDAYALGFSGDATESDLPSRIEAGEEFVGKIQSSE